MTAGYRQLIAQLHARCVRVIGATLAPFEGALPDSPLDDYFQPEKDALRHQVNDWIRHSHAFDSVVDFDAVLRDPAHPARMLAACDSGDHLHPGDEGLRAMADAVDLRALLPELVSDLTGAQLATSCLIMSLNCCGVFFSTEAPSLAKASFTSGLS